MRIDSEVLAAFLHMQELDMQIIRAEKQLQELPERKAVADAMAKRRAVAAKAEQVEKLAAKAEDKLARITEEDDGLPARPAASRTRSSRRKAISAPSMRAPRS